MKKKENIHPDGIISRMLSIHGDGVIVRTKIVDKDGKKEENLSIQMMSTKSKRWKEISKEFKSYQKDLKKIPKKS